MAVCPTRRTGCVLYMLLLAALVLGGCASKPQPDQQTKDIIACGVDRLSGPLAASKNVLQTAVRIYDGLQAGAKVEAVVRTVYGKDVRNLSPSERDEVVLILAGLDGCARVSPQLKMALDGVVETLVALGATRGGQQPNPANLRVVCRNSAVFGSQQLRYQPDCGPPTIAGDWTFSRSLRNCVNLPEGCTQGPLELHFTACTDTQCTMARDTVWRNTHTITRKDLNTWSADFDDIAVQCTKTKPATLNTGSYSITLVTDTISPGTSPLAAATLVGTMSYTRAAPNPPCPEVNITAEYALTGAR
jgi:hypothetical protein